MYVIGASVDADARASFPTNSSSEVVIQSRADFDIKPGMTLLSGKHNVVEQIGVRVAHFLISFCWLKPATPSGFCAFRSFQLFADSLPRVRGLHHWFANSRVPTPRHPFAVDPKRRFQFSVINPLHEPSVVP